MRWDKAARLAGSWSKARRPPVFLRIRQDFLPLGVGEGAGVGGSRRGLDVRFVVIAGIIQPCGGMRTEGEFVPWLVFPVRGERLGFFRQGRKGYQGRDYLAEDFVLVRTLIRGKDG